MLRHQPCRVGGRTARGLGPKRGNGCSRFSGGAHPSSLRFEMAKQDPAQAVTEMPEATAHLRFGVFDKRVMLPMSQLPGAVSGETNEILPRE